MKINLFKILLLTFVLISCKNSNNLTILFSLPKEIKESSAVQIVKNSDLIWTLQDKNNAPNLYGISHKGQLVHTVKVTDADNNDWEDLTTDESGNLYIGDFGNNTNDRQNLSIYKINNTDLTKNETTIAYKIEFYYPEQKSFPPKKSQRIYDAESFFYWENHFYIVTKNRSSAFDGTTALYKIPNKTGRYPAQIIGQFKTCDNYNHCAITSADINSDGSQVVLLSSDKIWLFSEYKNDAFFDGEVLQYELDIFSQKEGICFVDNKRVFITDERTKKIGGNLYEFIFPD